MTAVSESLKAQGEGSSAQVQSWLWVAQETLHACSQEGTDMGTLVISRYKQA